MAANGQVPLMLIHGAWLSARSWENYADYFAKRGFAVSAPEWPRKQGDVEQIRETAEASAGLGVQEIVDHYEELIRGFDHPPVLVGHSYGGAVITEAGNHPNVVALVYIAAFAPDKGESVNTLIANPPPGAPVPPILPPKDGFLLLDREKFAASFAGDAPAEQAAFMADSQVPWGVDALGGSITDPAWRTKPSWYLVTTEDRMIPPPAQRAMSERAGSTVVEVAGSHAVYVSQPAAVAALIEQASSAVTTG